MSTSLPILAWGTYRGALKRALHQLKYQDRPDVAGPLGHELGRLWQQTAVLKRHSVVVVPIPLHPERLRQRGYNQAELIAQDFCRVTGLSYLAQGLLRVKATEVQHQLAPSSRQTNLRSAFRVGPDWGSTQRSKSVLLVDDIYTTGATAEAAANELRQAGVNVVGMATVARALLRHPGATAAGARDVAQKPQPHLTR